MPVQADPAEMLSLEPLNFQFDGCCASSSLIDRYGTSIVTGGGFTGSPIDAIERNEGLRGTRFVAAPINTVVTEPSWVAADFKSRQIFIVGDSASSNTPTQNHWSEDLHIRPKIWRDSALSSRNVSFTIRSLRGH
jgi:hypothetical protein